MDYRIREDNYIVNHEYTDTCTVTVVPNVKIYLSPENQNKSSSNTIDFYGTERERMEQLAHALYSYLSYQLKLNVTIGDLTIGYEPIDAKERRDESNTGNYDLHICLHSNAFDGIATGPRVFYLDSDIKGTKIAQNVYDKLFDLYKISFPNASKTDTKNTGSDYLEVRETNATVILVEVAFHDVVTDAHWIINNMQEIAKAIGNGVLKYILDNYN